MSVYVIQLPLVSTSTETSLSDLVILDSFPEGNREKLAFLCIDQLNYFIPLLLDGMSYGLDSIHQDSPDC